MTEVLLARMVPGRTRLFDLDEQLPLQRQILEHGLDHIVGIAHGGGEVGGRPHALDRGRILAEIAQIGPDPIFDACRG